VPTLYIVLLLLAIGIARKQVHKIVSLLLKFNFKLNSTTIYFFPCVALVNLGFIVFLYSELAQMIEPTEMAQKTEYYERLYRNYRNFLINATSVVLIFQIFYSGRVYADYVIVKDKMTVQVKQEMSEVK
jgi:hypothetical protein